MKILLAAAACLATLPCVHAGDWTVWQVDEPTWAETPRTYRKYTPSLPTAAGVTTIAGVVVFFHGAGGSSADHPAWEVAKWADEFGFLALVPDGSSGGGGGGSGGGGGPGKGGPNALRRTLKGGPGGGGGGGSYSWNIEDTSGVDEVAFIQKMLADESGNHTPDVPEIAFGFSNGAGMASLMCCYNSTDLFVAHTGCHIDSNAEFTDSCSTVVSGKGRRHLAADGGEGEARLLQTTQSDTKTYNAVGDEDFFLDTVEVPGLFLQFADRASEQSCPTTSPCPDGYDGSRCSDTTSSSCPYESCSGNDSNDQANNATRGFTCYVYPDCDKIGSLCLYDNLGHSIEGSMTAAAWASLSGNTAQYTSTSGGGGGGGGGGSDCTGGEKGCPCDDGSNCASGRCKGNGSCS
ncbi:hypothetical protein ACHAXT_001822 [Thalassiosira profunda]